MRLAIMQPYFFPYLGYFALIKSVDKFVLYDDVDFINRGWINRNRICIADKPKFITVPLSKQSQNKTIREHSIINDSKWRLKLIKSIEFNYKGAPNFNEVFPILKDLIEGDYNSISDLNYHSLRIVNEHLGIETTIEKSSAIYKNSDLKGRERIIDICKKEEADCYVNPESGIHLYNASEFEKEGIKLNYIYDHFGIEVKKDECNITTLSVIHALLMRSPDEIIEIMSKTYRTKNVQ